MAQGKNKKLTAKELQELQALVSKVQIKQAESASICASYIKQKKALEKTFEEEYNHIEHEIKSITNKQKDFIKHLHNKYGKDVAFDFTTGDVKKQ